MKKAIVVVMVLIFSSTCFGMELNKAQKNILKHYPSLSKKEKIELFIKFSNIQAEKCPFTLDSTTEITSIVPILDEPGIKYIAHVNFEKKEFSSKKWDGLFKIIEQDAINSICSNPSGLFYKKLKEVVIIYEYYDKNSSFLKRIAIDLRRDCTVKEKNSIKSLPKKYNPSQNEEKSFQADVKSQVFLKLEQINQAIKHSPTNAINYYNRGILYTSELQHDMAIMDYSKAIEIDPKFSLAYLNRSTEYLFLNDLNHALSDCSKVIQLNPNLSEAYFNRAKIKLHMGKIEGSLKDMKKAAKLGNSGAVTVLQKNRISWD